MDAAFNLDDNYRANFLRVLMQSLGCTYISIWKYNPSNYFLFFLDGLYHEDTNTQLPSSSSGSLARRLFDEYSQSVILGVAENDQVPGLAFRNSTPYLELQELDLRRLASNDTQRQFYQTAVFMGCKIGEIELGLSNVPQMNMKMELRSWFPEAFPSQTQLGIDQDNIIPSQTQLAEQINPIRPPTDNQKPLAASSSSSSLRSLSMDNSPEYSSLLFNINNPTTTTPPPNTTSPHNAINISQAELQIDPNNIPLLMQPLLPSHEPLMILPHQQAMQAFARLRNVQFPTPETEDAAMTKAILAVLTSASAYNPASSSSSSANYSADHPHHHLINPKSSAFKNYDSTSTTPSASALDRHRLSLKKGLFKRSVSFFRSLNLMRNRQRLQAAAATAAAAAAASATTYRPTTSTQLHHMISERKRREKINESFQSLRSLLPPGTKKDKASVLNTTTEYLNSLKAQVEELSRRNKQLEAQVLSQAPAGIRLTEANKNGHSIIDSSSTSDHQRVDVRIIRHVSESTSEAAELVIDLQVILRAAIPVDDLVLRILEFLKTDENVSLMSMDANTHLTESSSTSLNRVTLRLRVEGSEWDESAFQEAVRRVVADLAQ
ncbi:Basic helix-loop-helix transcription factor [Trema orientale]|uniref:Basic helix-loop-helix transcription factor n=1 Tax=Trema orientale TaxID=63057 RepID=A0A2P5EFX7_TREOI|nr:Basic helix-loop-helix transcription factor [Trema orientale]